MGHYYFADAFQSNILCENKIIESNLFALPTIPHPLSRSSDPAIGSTIYLFIRRELLLSPGVGDVIWQAARYK